ncbi:MAG TPA: hypothetical protein VGD17_11345 [Chitinophagaceae bacterium]
MKKLLSFAFALVSVASLISCQKDVATTNDPIPELISGNGNQSVPFNGSYTTSAQILNPPPMMRQQIIGHGQAPHLGKSTFVAISNVNFTVPPPFPISGTCVWTAANGDEFYSSFVGTATPTGQGTNNVVMTHTITGGTGRFSDATGTITGHTVATPGHSEGHVTYEGTISY